MTATERQAAAEEIVRCINRQQSHVDDISAILARHDTATVGDAAAEAASLVVPSYAPNRSRLVEHAASVIQRAISASERELVEVARSLANNLPDSELELARENWGNTNVAVVKHWRDEVRAVLAKRGW